MIPYIGNKSTLSDFILPHCPKNPDFWVEPFGGMFGLFFSLNLKDYPDTKFIYNDCNPLNCNLFEQLKRTQFINKVLGTKVDKDFYLECFENLSSKSKESRALSWLVVLICGDLKDIMSKNYRGNAGFEVFKYKLPRYRDYFNRIEVFNLDYEKIIEQYDGNSNTFFYFDPPYWGFSDYYTNHNWSDDNYSGLRDSLINMKSPWVLSTYDYPEMQDGYKDYKMVSKKHNMGTEWLVINSLNSK